MERYDHVADVYDLERQNTSDSPEIRGSLSDLLSAVGGEIEGWDVIELGCGQGHLARELTRRGARVTAVDLSMRMIEIAQSRYPSEGIRYLVDDIQSLSTIPDATFDLAVCQFSLMDLPDLDSAMRTAARVLRPAGKYCFTVMHPCFRTPSSRTVIDQDGQLEGRLVVGYISEGERWSSDPSSLRSKIGSWHRRLGTYLNTFVRAGFLLQGVTEQDFSARAGLPNAVPYTLQVWGQKAVK